MPNPTQIAEARRRMEEVVGTIEQPLTILVSRRDSLTDTERGLDEKIEAIRTEAEARIAEIHDQMEREIAPLQERRESLHSDRMLLNQLLEAFTPVRDKLQEGIRQIAPSNPPVPSGKRTSASSSARPVSTTRPVLGNGNK